MKKRKKQKARAAQADARKISNSVDRNAKALTRLSDEIWSLAETAYQEHQSSALLRDYLESEGFEIERNPAGLETAFVARRGKDGPVAAFLGEYDALPGMSQQDGVARREPREAGAAGHACGHNLLGVGCLAAAVALIRHLEQTGRPGRVWYFGCPAEEHDGAKVALVRAGAFAEVDFALTWHPSDAHYVSTSPTLAIEQLLFHFTGRSAHAASGPHLGRSALDAIELTGVGTNYLREHIISEARIHYAITNSGGTAANVVPAEAEAAYIVRAPKVSQLQEIRERLIDVARGAALMTGTELTVRRDFAYANRIPNLTLERQLQHNLEILGPPAYTREEFAFAKEIRQTLPSTQAHRFPVLKGKDLADTLSPFQPHAGMHFASTDVGDVSQAVPTSEYRGGVWACGTQPHSWQAAAQGKSSIAHKGMLLAAKVLAAAASDMLSDSKQIARARKDLARALQEKT